MSVESKKPLDGIRVMDLTRVVSGPFCTRMLADCGAEVIKVEPVGGEHMRLKEPMREEASTYYGHANAGKKSITVDFRSEDGVKTLRDLAAISDVVVENFRPGVTEKLGLDYASLALGRPDLIYCSISGFGQKGPRSEHPAYAPILHALSGHDLTMMDYQSDMTAPPLGGIWYADVIGGVFAFGAVQTALIGKLRHGIGQFIDVALMDAMINILVVECQEAQTPSQFPRWLATPTPATDGYVITVPITQKIFERTAEVIGRPELKDDVRFNSQREREKNWTEWMKIVGEWTSGHPAKACEKILMDAGVPCARYLTVSEAIKDEQVTARNLMSTVGTGASAFQVPNLPFQMSNSSISVAPFVAPVGAHNDEIATLIRDHKNNQRDVAD